MEFNPPYAEIANRASESISTQDVDRFCESLRSQLKTVAEFRGLNIAVERVPECFSRTWECLCTEFYGGKSPHSYNNCAIQEFLQAANKTVSINFINVYGSGGLLLGKFTQKRNWNFTQARLLTKEIAWMDFDIF